MGVSDHFQDLGHPMTAAELNLQNGYFAGLGAFNLRAMFQAIAPENQE